MIDWDKLLLDGRLQWEILATGAIALLAAWWTVKGVRDQIRQTERIETNRRDRRERAVRTMLPLALSRVVDYGESCLVLLASADPQRAKPPDIPNDILSIFRDCIEFGDHESPAVQAMIKLIDNLQVQHDRLVSHARSGSSGRVRRRVSYLPDLIWDAADVSARATSLFDFARDEEGATVKMPEMRTVLLNAGCFRTEQMDELLSEWQQRS